MRSEVVKAGWRILYRVQVRDHARSINSSYIDTSNKIIYQGLDDLPLLQQYVERRLLEGLKQRDVFWGC